MSRSVTPSNCPSRTPILTAALLLAAAAATASARPADVCNPTLPYSMPDHDQARATAPGVVGLQNGGVQYCVPTCTMNILTYLQNHGYPALSAGPGPGPWLGTQPIYNSFSTDIESLASLMNTDPLGGTGGDDAFAGVNDWIDNAGLTGDIIVTMMGTTISSAPELGDIAFALLARCPISLSVGWYTTDNNGFITRAGGHCVTATRLPDFCTNSRKLSIRDPGNSIGSSNTSQAAGTTETYGITTQNVLRVNGNQVVYSGPYERINGYASSGKTAFIDGYRAYTPAFGLSACNNPVNGSCIHQFMPNPSFTNLPQSTHDTLPAGASTIDLDLAADNLSTWILQFDGDGDVDGRDFLVWQRNIGASPVRRIFPALDAYHPRRLVCGRDPRTLFFLDNNPHLIVRLNTATGVATPMSMPDAISAICFDEQADELIAFSSAARRVTRVNASTLAPGTGKTLAASVIAGPDPRIAFSHVSGLLWLVSGTNTGYGLIPGNTGDDLLIGGTVSHTEPLRGVDTDDRGHVFTTSGGQTLEFAGHPTTVLAWARVDGVSKFGSLADGPLFRIARSRTNYQRGLHDQPGETMSFLPDSFAASVADCPADFNLSGAVSVQDIFDFLAAYFANDPTADFNESGAITVQDIFDFLAAYFTGCR